MLVQEWECRILKFAFEMLSLLDYGILITEFEYIDPEGIVGKAKPSIQTVDGAAIGWETLKQYEGMTEEEINENVFKRF